MDTKASLLNQTGQIFNAALLSTHFYQRSGSSKMDLCSGEAALDVDAVKQSLAMCFGLLVQGWDLKCRKIHKVFPVKIKLLPCNVKLWSNSIKKVENAVIFWLQRLRLSCWNFAMEWLIMLLTAWKIYSNEILIWPNFTEFLSCILVLVIQPVVK